MKKRILLWLLIFVLILGFIPYNRFVNTNTGVKIYQSLFYAVAQTRNEHGDFELSHIYWFPESLYADETLHKKEIS